MKRALFAAVATAGLMTFGCDDSNTQKAATPETEKAAEKVSEKAVDTAQGVEKSVQGGVDQMKDKAGKDSPTGVAAENLRGNMEDLTGKLKTALQERKFDEAQTFVQQLKDLKGKLPAEAQVQVDTQLAEADKAIAAGKALMNPAGK